MPIPYAAEKGAIKSGPCANTKSLAVTESGQDDDDLQGLSMAVLFVKYCSASVGLAIRSTLIELSHDRVNVGL
jgi:hypothetical protein